MFILGHLADGARRELVDGERGGGDVGDLVETVGSEFGGSVLLDVVVRVHEVVVGDVMILPVI